MNQKLVKIVTNRSKESRMKGIGYTSFYIFDFGIM